MIGFPSTNTSRRLLAGAGAVAVAVAAVRASSTHRKHYTVYAIAQHYHDLYHITLSGGLQGLKEY